MAAVAEQGSLNKAAIALYMTQPNLSNAIASLEKKLEIQFFDHTNSGMVLTKKSAIINTFIQQVQKSLSEFRGKETP